MTPIEVLQDQLVRAEQRRDIASSEDRYARMVHFKAQQKFTEAVDEVKALLRAIEVLNNQ